MLELRWVKRGPDEAVRWVGPVAFAAPDTAPVAGFPGPTGPGGPPGPPGSGAGDPGDLTLDFDNALI